MARIRFWKASTSFLQCLSVCIVTLGSLVDLRTEDLSLFLEKGVTSFSWCLIRLPDSLQRLIVLVLEKRAFIQNICLCLFRECSVL